MLKTHNCGELRAEHAGQTVTLAGWVHRHRDQGGLIFIDLRDRWGITQMVINQETDSALHEQGQPLRSEWVIQVEGEVIQRPDGMTNKDLATGAIEINVKALNILNQAKTTPFYINKEEPNLDEALRMKYRYLDLRRAKMQRNIILRHEVALYIRKFLSERGFVEIETPILFKTTPEGARDYLVPSRVHPGKFYALPQSPQQLKQLLMVAGYERYFQITRCFRDEDQRGDRQPEFTQLDLEMSFVEREDILQLIEQLVTEIVANLTEFEMIYTPFKRISHKDAMDFYGTDRPDFRYDLRSIDITELAGKSGFSVFVDNANSGKFVKAMRVPGFGEWSNGKIKKLHKTLEDIAREAGAKGLAYMVLPSDEEGEVRGPIGKFFPNDLKLELFDTLEAEGGDLLLFISDEYKVICNVVDALRPYLARELNLLDSAKIAFGWVIDFPLFEWNEDEERWDPSHHLFTSPFIEDIPLLDTDPGKVRGQQYDLVCNGYEVAGGSIRIHQRDVQEKIMSLIGLSDEEAQEKFGHMLTAFEYGTPPHGGIAPGLDRLVMILAGEPNIREVIAFPKTQQAADIMAGAPSFPFDDLQLEELHIRSVMPAETSEPSE